MVIPMPAIQVSAVPTEYALKRRNFFWAFASILVVCSVVQITMFLNIIPGFMMFVIGLVGLYCIREKSVDMNCLMTWGMICAVNGVFDTVFLIDRAVKMDKPIFTLRIEHALLYNLMHLVILSGPTAELCTAWLSYKVYQDAASESGADQNFMVDNYHSRQNGNSASGGGVGSAFSGSGPSFYGGSAISGGGGSSLNSASTAFQPFGGKGNKLNGGGSSESCESD
ncbi:unnamed protein product [Amoebophrya sp. A25]|nr:unnamed protein product [Amoebophrya sp. A25]|eukprot:GSA25T00000277001.1